MTSRRAFTTALAIVVAAFAAACTAPAGGTPGTTTTTLPVNPDSPTITDFRAEVPSGPAPLAVALRWTIADPQNLDLLCELDLDDDGVYERTIVSCTSATVRTESFTTPGTTTVRLRVSNGAAPAVTATTAVQVGAPADEPFDITLELLGSFTPARTSAFTAAAARWSQVVHAGLPDLTLTYAADGCGTGSPAFDGSIDDVRIVARVAPIDGVGKVLASAGPCYYRTSSGLSVAGSMLFDEADIVGLENSGDLGDVVLHEMGHVLGIGTLDPWNGLRTGVGTGATAFTGAHALGVWQVLGGTGAVPLENTGGGGTADSHWRETTFGRELMTGFEDPGADPLSRLTVASLADMGYAVDLAAADPFLLPLPGSVRAAARSTAPATEQLLLPVGGV